MLCCVVLPGIIGGPYTGYVEYTPFAFDLDYLVPPQPQSQPDEGTTTAPVIEDVAVAASSSDSKELSEEAPSAMPQAAEVPAEAEEK